MEPLVVLREPAILKVKVEPIEAHLKHRWKLLEPDKLPGILLPILLRIILIGTIKLLRLNILHYGILNCSVALNRQLQGIKHFVPRRLVVNIQALDDVLEFSLEKPLVGALDLRAEHLLFELVTQYAVEFIDVLLLVFLRGGPAEGLCQLVGSDSCSRFGRHLQVVEDSLEAKWYLV